MTTIGEELVAQLALRGVECVFGIPGVHTIELYRGLASSDIRHVTPRHEQGAGFMADGYARVSGKPGVAFVITGPGLTNTLSAMAQARADSVPMLVVSGVNILSSLGKGMGHLHELPDQQALAAMVALISERIEASSDLLPALERAFSLFKSARPGPVHIELPLDVSGRPYEVGAIEAVELMAPLPSKDQIAQAAKLLGDATSPVILAGGGARRSCDVICKLAERLNAPVVQTVNARGIMHGHPLSVPASPSLQAVRELIGASDVVLAVGTELGPTDYDMYATNTMPRMNNLIRIDICPSQLARHPAAVAISDTAETTLRSLKDILGLGEAEGTGVIRADKARRQAFYEIGDEMRAIYDILEATRVAVPSALMVGDSTQPVYAGNLYYDHDRASGWFNAATGFGALGYGIPAAIGAAIAAPSTPVICLVGDGGAQFSLPELMVAVDENLPIIFMIWNSHGFQEIETSMRAVGVTVVGCDPTPPDFAATAQSISVPYTICKPDPTEVGLALKQMAANTGPSIIEVHAPLNAKQPWP